MISGTGSPRDKILILDQIVSTNRRLSDREASNSVRFLAYELWRARLIHVLSAFRGTPSTLRTKIPQAQEMITNLSLRRSVQSNYH